ncbi:MAG: hypothetical protein ACRCZ2_01260, partial [Fusobacteriaceae bacterium]
MRDIVEIIEMDFNKKVYFSGYAIIGKNNSGKTYQLLNLLSKVENQKRVSYEYSVQNLIFLSKEMAQGEIDGDENELKEGLEPDFDSTGIEEKIIDFKNDLFNSQPISRLVYGELINKEKYYNQKLKDFLGIEIHIGEEVQIRDEGSKEFVDLKSSGYISLIRTFIILYKLLTSETQYILLDELDDSIDFNHKTYFINFIEKIKKEKKSTAQVIFVTHNSETVFNLPQNYKILKIKRGESIKPFYSQDFMTKDRLEKAIFDTSTREHYISENLK